MENTVAQLQALLNAVGARVVVGLRQQGHLPTIDRMLDEGKSWEDIGRVIGWNPDAARRWYEWEMDQESRST